MIKIICHHWRKVEVGGRRSLLYGVPCSFFGRGVDLGSRIRYPQWRDLCGQCLLYVGRKRAVLLAHRTFVIRSSRRNDPLGRCFGIDRARVRAPRLMRGGKQRLCYVLRCCDAADVLQKGKNHDVGCVVGQ